MLQMLFARRYLFSRKSHSVINIISAVSILSVGVPVAAMVILLSVFNGLQGVVEGMFNAFDPDLAVSARLGKTFPVERIDTAALRRIKGVKAISAVLDQSALLRYGERQAIATVRGVDSDYFAVTHLQPHLVAGALRVRLGQIEEAVAGQGIAYELGLRLAEQRYMEVFAPRRTATVSSLLPVDAFSHRRIWPAGVFALDAETDSRYLLTSIDFARELFAYPGRASSLLLRLEADADPERVRERVTAVLGPEFEVATRYEQKASMYRIMLYEKWGVFFISLLVLVIASFSIVGSLAMLIIDKRPDIATLRAMGGSERFIRGIFLREGMLIGGIGSVAGLLLGIAFCLGQQHFGWIALPSRTFLIQSYPVEMKASDLAAVVAAFTLVCYPIARFTAAAMIRRSETREI